MRVCAQCLAVLVILYGAAQLLARRACRGGALRERIATALQERLGPVELGPEVQVDALFRVRCGPLTIPGAQPTDPPLLRIELLRVRPDLVALARTRRAVPASIRLYGVHLEIPERSGSLHEVLERFGGPRSPRPGPVEGPAAETPGGPTVRIRDLTVGLALGGQHLTAGPIQANLYRRPAPGGGVAVSADVRFPGAGQGTLLLRRDAEGWHVTSRLDRLGARALPPELSSLSAAWAGGELAVSLSGDAAPGLVEARAHLVATGTALQIAGRAVGAKPIGPLDLRLECALSWDTATRRLRLEPATIDLPGGARAAVTAALELRKGLPFTLEARADGVDYLRTVSALPAALALPPEAPRPPGTLDARASLAGPLLDPAAWRVDAGIDLSRMREAAHLAPPVALRGPFVQHVRPEQGPEHAFVIGPANPGFVPVDELPRYVIRAVTASEDGGFFGHSGFDFEELRNAAVAGAQAGHVVRGGSTITQQLAKNLFLSREKTLGRKLREALLTVALEATVPKQRLMEIYLNVAEWGPGLWGIGPAARHWFGKDARRLTPREAAFLATVIPNPVRYHYMWTRGWLTEGWSQRVDELLRRMNTQGALTDEELAEALEQPLAFANPEAVRPAVEDEDMGATGEDPAPDGGSADEDGFSNR